MCMRLLAACFVSAFLTNVALADEKADQKAREALDKKLTELKAPKGELVQVTGDSLTRSFPKQCFFVLRYRQFPVAILPPEPLKSNNLFIVHQDNTIEHLTDSKALEKFFLANFPPVKKEEDGKDAARNWLRLAQEFHQDGFYKFSIPDKFEMAGTDDVPQSQLTVSGKAVVAPEGGNKGEITVNLKFEKGKLAKITEGGQVFAGARPRCQATKLLDPDPIVRAMAEQSLVVMGSAAKSYLDEQRAKAGPELQAAIDRIWRRIVDEGR